MMDHLRGNQARWESLLQQELAEETRTEISEAEEIPDEEVDGDIENDNETQESRKNSLNGGLDIGDRVSYYLFHFDPIL